MRLKSKYCLMEITYVFYDKRPFLVLKVLCPVVPEEGDCDFDVLRYGPDDEPAVWVLDARLPRVQLQPTITKRAGTPGQGRGEKKVTINNNLQEEECEKVAGGASRKKMLWEWKVWEQKKT